MAERVRCCAPDRRASRWARTQMRHWFDGLAMLHRFTIAGGGVSYGGRYLHGRSYRAARRARGARLRGVRDRPLPLDVQARAEHVRPRRARMTDNANVNVTRLGERFIAMTESPMPVQFDPQTLRHRRRAPLRDPRRAHHRPPASRSRQRRDAQLRRQPRAALELPLLHGRPAVAAAPRVIASLPVREPAYMHSFGLSERFLVLAEFPFVVNPLDARAGAAAVHRELPLEARAGHPLHAVRSLQRRGRWRASHARPASPFTTSTPSTTASRSWSTSAPTRTRASSRTSTSSACAPASRSRGPSWRRFRLDLAARAR